MRGESYLSLLKLARPRTWAFAVSMWLVAYYSTGRATLFLSCVGAFLCAAGTAGSNFINTLTDIEEDAINLPVRVHLLRKAGIPRVRIGAVIGHALPVILSLIFFNYIHSMLIVLAALDSILYSWGPRLKKGRWSSLIALSGVVILPFAAGWSAAADLRHLDPVIAVIGFFFAANINLKNLPDITGDELAGIRSLARGGASGEETRFLTGALLVPYLLLGIFLLLNITPSRYAFLLLLFPLALYIIYRLSGARTRVERDAIYTIGFFYQVVFIILALSLYYPHPETAITLGVLYLLTIVIGATNFDSRP